MRYGPAEGITRSTRIGVSVGTAQNTGIATRARRSPAGAVRRIVSLLPLATTPEMCVALPAMYARAPTMSAKSAASGSFSLGLRLRSIEYLNVWAVTG